IGGVLRLNPGPRDVGDVGDLWRLQADGLHFGKEGFQNRLQHGAVGGNVDWYTFILQVVSGQDSFHAFDGGDFTGDDAGIRAIDDGNIQRVNQQGADTFFWREDANHAAFGQGFEQASADCDDA